MQFEAMLQELQTKISEVKALKHKIDKEVFLASHNKSLGQFLKNQLKPWLISSLGEYSKFQMAAVSELRGGYQAYMANMKGFYESEVDELRTEIKRQYKVIGLMKLEVEDLMLLLNQSEINRRQQSVEQRITNASQREPESESRSLSSLVISDLEIIEEAETERTIVSSASAEQDRGDPVTNFIRIEEEQGSETARVVSSFREDRAEEVDLFESENRKLVAVDDDLHQSEQNPLKPITEASNLTDKMLKESLSQKKPDPSLSFASLEQYPYCTSQVDENDSLPSQSHDEMSNLKNSNASQKYGSIPISMGSKITMEEPSSFESDFLNDITNFQNTPISGDSKISNNEEIRSSKCKQPKTKQFLQEFRKTFNKCLSSMEAKHKHSTKINSKHARQSFLNQNNTAEINSNNDSGMAVTFGKNKKISESVKCPERERDSQSNMNVFKKNIFNPKKNSPSQNSEKEKQPGNQEFGKFIDCLLKDREKNSRFLVGEKKYQTRYEGEKRDNMRHGNGTLYYSNGLCFEGEFKNGVKDGFGILKFNHIQIYNGSWKGDEINGQGKIRNCAIINKRKTQNQVSSCVFLSKWISYCGEFKNNRFEGHGTLYLQGGEKFQGKFVAGLAAGQGALFKKNGEIQSGIWKNNSLIKT